MLHQGTKEARLVRETCAELARHSDADPTTAQPVQIEQHLAMLDSRVAGHRACVASSPAMTRKLDPAPEASDTRARAHEHHGSVQDTSEQAEFPFVREQLKAKQKRGGRTNTTWQKGIPYGSKGLGKGGPAKGAGIAFGSAGDGWGGAAKGPGRRLPSAPAFEPGNRAGASRADPDWDRIANVEKTDAENARILRQNLFDLAQNAEREETRVRATEAALNRLEGMPVARNLTVNGDLKDLSDEALAAELQRLRAKQAAADGAPGVAPEMSSRSSRVLD